jgi:hypothetical protein
MERPCLIDGSRDRGAQLCPGGIKRDRATRNGLRGPFRPRIARNGPSTPRRRLIRIIAKVNLAGLPRAVHPVLTDLRLVIVGLPFTLPAGPTRVGELREVWMGPLPKDG